MEKSHRKSRKKVYARAMCSVSNELRGSLGMHYLRLIILISAGGNWGLEVKSRFTPGSGRRVLCNFDLKSRAAVHRTGEERESS
jgi:hypothetical protein